MSEERRRARFWSSVWATAIAGGVAAVVPAHARQDAASAFTGGEDEEEADEVLFEADEVVREFDDGPIVAEGDVRAYFGERYLRADRLIYDPATDIVTAEGDVSITDEDLETVFAGRVILSGDLRDGVVENFSALLEDNARVAADSAFQEQGARTRLRKAVYTACNVCDDDGSARTPTWRIKALRVTRDRERKVVRFRHAFFEFKGVPILYTPFLQGPDPSVERQSGFLTPRVGASSRQGFNFELPYYFALSDSQDATFHPRYTTEDGTLWQGEYRLRRRRGYHVLAGGVLDFDNTGDEEEDIPGVRWHYFAEGYREFGNHWRASYDVERVSDNTYLREYDIERQGDLRQELDRGRTNQLRSNARFLRGGEQSRLSIDTYLFQNLRDSPADPNATPRFDAEFTPYVLPLIDFQHRFQPKILGGELSAGANTAALFRIEGADSQRFTASLDWDRDIITKGGHRFHLFAQTRGDLYLFQDRDQGTEIISSIEGDPDVVEARFAPTAGVEWSYPLARNVGSARLFLEPRIQIVASPSGLNDDDIINEDSQSIEFDYAGLFDFNKSTGFDAFEDGQRINMGLAASASWPSGVTIEGSAGRQYRLQDTEAFNFSSGLGETSSDIVGSLNFYYKDAVGVENRFRINEDTGAFARAESMAFFRAGPVSGRASYVRLSEENPQTDLISREELTAGASVDFLRNWRIGAGWRLDLESNQTIRQDFSIAYNDECSTFGLTLRRDRTRTATLEPDNAILFTFTLRTLVQ